tara:strand:- start:438 stop:992 length:555 start_codon:yes stop_codon:yes gene_type:complete
MKKLLLLLLFVPLISFGQDDITVVQSKTSISNETNIENELVLSSEKTTIKTPLTADLNNYTQLALVKVNRYYSTSYTKNNFSENGHWQRSNFEGYEPVEQLLSMSVFEIINPYKFDRRRFKKDQNYLKEIKKETYLYLYLTQNVGRGDDINTSIVVRDWKNKLIYSATHINTGLNEVLAPLIDY